MARFVCSADAIGLTTSTLKTLCELATGSGDSAKLVAWWVEFDGTDATKAPVKVELLRATAAATGTSTGTVGNMDENDAAAVSGTWKYGASGEGTPGTVLEIHRIPFTSGTYIFYPLDNRYTTKLSGFLRIRATAPSAVNATVGMIWEE